jgi:hypothetical protein
MLSPIKQALRRWTPRSRVAAAAPSSPVASVAINMRPTTSPWGGGNQWLAQIVRYLTGRGYRVRFDLGARVDVIVIVDPRVGGLIEFGLDAVAEYRQRFSGVHCVQRINECDARKGTSVVDRLLAEANRGVDFTVFVSEWLRDYHASRWFDRSRPHAVVVNGADPAIFHPLGADVWAPGKSLRLVTHHWSDNWNKGFSVYQEVDRLIAEGRLPDTELWAIGRWPKEIRWRAARTFTRRAAARSRSAAATGSRSATTCGARSTRPARGTSSFAPWCSTIHRRGTGCAWSTAGSCSACAR